jgi:hypothetical protein
MLSALVEATGFELDLRLRRAPHRLDALRGPVGRRVRARRQDLIDAAARHGAVNLRVFGSVARGQDREDSDVDLLADLPPALGLLGLGRLQGDLEKIVGAPVDVVAAGDLKSDVRERVERDLVAL